MEQFLLLFIDNCEPDNTHPYAFAGKDLKDGLRNLILETDTFDWVLEELFGIFSTTTNDRNQLLDSEKNLFVEVATSKIKNSKSTFEYIYKVYKFDSEFKDYVEIEIEEENE